MVDPVDMSEIAKQLRRLATDLRNISMEVHSPNPKIKKTSRDTETIDWIEHLQSEKE